MSKKDLTFDEAWILGWQRARDMGIGLIEDTEIAEEFSIEILSHDTDIGDAYLSGYAAYFEQTGE